MEGKRLKQIRLYLGLTQAGLAEKLEISEGYVSLMENDLKPISDRVRINLAKCFSVDDKFIETIDKVNKFFDSKEITK
ncbi:helix-turn-helix domain-containing protein [Bacillus sp. JJ1562]|uniref:helix-turn-helix domain-containing protein n=1 Tax=Bacillus sp. JJ1562 TaxID=3122960 RepID=UPI003001E50D